MAARHVVLMGLMGSGKTSIGAPLAERLGRPFLDNDVALQRRAGRTAREIAATDGTDALHDEEAAAVLDALATLEPAVIGAAASTIESPKVRDALREHFVVWLDTDLDVLAHKLARKEHRPEVTGSPREFLERQRDRRGPLLRDVASLVIGSDRSDDAGTVERIVRAVR